MRRGRQSVLSIVSYGTVLSEALEAAEILSHEKIPVDVINARFAAPVDEKLVAGLARGKGLITVEDHMVACGFGSAVLELAATAGLDTGAIRVLGAPRRFIRHNSRRAQLMEAGVVADDIVRTAKDMLVRRGGNRGKAKSH